MLGSEPADYDYFANVRNTYPAIFIVQIDSANPVRADGAICHYRYRGRVEQQVRGKFGKPEIEFDSNVGLTAGGEYLIYFLEEQAKLYHPAIDFISVVDAGSTPEQQKVQREAQEEHSSHCAAAMRGYFFAYWEIHDVDRAWDMEHQRIKYRVMFNDAFQDYPPGEMEERISRFVDFDYVKRELSRH